MKALIYLTRRSFINNLKKAVRKPTTLLALIFGIAYAVFIIISLMSLAATVKMNSVKGLIIIITLWTLYSVPGNFLSYSSRKGIIFRPGHAHFVFPSPISPKMVLISSAWMNFIMSFIVWALLAFGGITVFQVPFWKVCLFFLAGFVMEIILEMSVMLFLYTNDTFPDKVMKVIRTGIKILLLAMTVLFLMYFRKNGLSVETAFRFIDWKPLQAIPVIGWQIALYRLILSGPEGINLICSVLYIVTVAVIFIFAVRMKCDGGYYEDAAKFADDYADLKERQKNGELVMSVGGKRRKLRRIKSHFSGTGAKAIFYRHLLEYKKEKFFIFNKLTLISLIVAIIFSYSLREGAAESGYARFFLLGVVAYVSFIFSAYSGKWESELKKPYIFLIPDTAVKKMWYATKMEHVKAFADGCIICLPIGIAWKIHPIFVVCCILIYVTLQADKMYTKVITLCIVGEVFGKTGQSLIGMVIQFTFLAAGAAAAAVAGIFLNPDFVFPIVLIYSMIVTVATGVLASLRFETMEQPV